MDVFRMDGYQRQRSGRTLVVAGALAGLVVGGLAGFATSPGRARPAAGAIAPPATQTTLPPRFWTVMLGSYDKALSSRTAVQARVRALRAQGVEAAMLDSSSYGHSLRPSFWAVFSGTFHTQAEAAAHRQRLLDQHPELANSQVRWVAS